MAKKNYGPQLPIAQASGSLPQRMKVLLAQIPSGTQKDLHRLLFPNNEMAWGTFAPKFNSDSSTVSSDLVEAIEDKFPELKGLFTSAPLYLLKAALGQERLSLILDPRINEEWLYFTQLFQGALEPLLHNDDTFVQAARNACYRIKLVTLRMPLLAPAQLPERPQGSGSGEAKSVAVESILFGGQIGWWGFSRLRIDIVVKSEDPDADWGDVEVALVGSKKELSKRNVAVIFGGGEEFESETAKPPISATLSVYPGVVGSISIRGSTTGYEFSGVPGIQSGPLPDATFWLDDGAILAVSKLPDNAVIEIICRADLPLGYELMPGVLKSSIDEPLSAESKSRLISVAKAAAEEVLRGRREDESARGQFQTVEIGKLRYVRKKSGD